MARFQVQGEAIDFEKLGYDTRLRSRDRASAEAICGLKLRAYDDEIRAKNTSQQAELKNLDHRGRSLRAHLYDRPDPVNDTEMLARDRKMRTYLTLAVCAAVAALAGNAVTFALYGYGMIVTALLAMCATVVPVVVGHLAFEKLLAQHKRAQAAVALIAAALCFGGLLLLSQARLQMADKATAPSSAHSFVDDQTDTPPDPDPNSEQSSEARVHDTVGQAMRLIAIGVDVILGLLVGLLTHMRADSDFAAWRELARIAESMMDLTRQIAERTVSVEIAKKLCMTGILRAENELNRRHPPYHLLALAVVLLLSVRFSSAQKIERCEGILIDTSASIGRSRANSELFREYLQSTKRLLLTEPPSTEVRVSVIATDSFGGVRELLKGWTPESRGVFTAGLNRARHQMASAFVARSAALSPGASGTDIFGALWQLNALFDAGDKRDPPQNLPKSIWLFSDMVNETPSFPMPELLSGGAEQMLDQAKAKGLIVPLRGYEIHVEGASPSGLTPQQWFTVRSFWAMYFAAAGAELVSYSAECNSLR